MDDQFMLSGLRKPSPAFARNLSEKLARLDAQPAPLRQQRPMFKAAAWAAVVLVSLSAFTLPAVRAAARQFLDMFRVVNFAPVRFDAARMSGLKTSIDLPQLFTDQLQVLKHAAPPQTVDSVAAAGELAGIRVREPAWRPVGFEQQTVTVIDDSAARMNVNLEQIQLVIDAIGIDDIRVPEEVDDQPITMHIPRAVSISYKDDKRAVTLVQARVPEISFPAGLDLSTIAEIALRVLGIDRGEAHRFAQSVDWRTTLLVPVPANVTSVKQVDVQGNPGLLMEGARRKPENNSATPVVEGKEVRLGGTVLMWSSSGSVYLLAGNLPSLELLEMAQSLQ